MAKLSKHALTTDSSRALCDAMLASFPPGSSAMRRSSPSYCGLYTSQRKSAVCWIHHANDRLSVWLDCEDTPATRHQITTLLSIQVSLQARPYPRKGMAIRTPLFFRVDTPEIAMSMGPVLEFVSSLRSDSHIQNQDGTDDHWLSYSEAEGGEVPIEEGKRVAVVMNRYERNRKNRDRCISAYGAICSVCDFDFAKVYGVIGEGYIHVHHLSPLSYLQGEPQRINPLKDLRPVCPNCHEMLHRAAPPYTIEQLRSLIANTRGVSN